MLLEQYFPPPDIVTSLQPEELSIPLLRCLLHAPDSELNLGNFVRSEEFDRYAPKEPDVVRKLTAEAWVWLETHLMIAPDFRQGSWGWFFVTERGKALAASGDLQKYERSNELSSASLDPSLASKVYPLFVRGDYDTSVFQAFKEVEVRVRIASGLSDEDYGVPLVRKAFNPENGPLTDNTQIQSEREATANLFAGSIGLFKNPASHRDVDLTDPQECADLVYLANQLLRMVERHATARKAGS